MTETEALAWVLSRSERWQDETGADWAITCEHALLGRVGLRSLDLAEGFGEGGYWVVPAARGRGIAVRALQTMSRWLFAEVGLHRIELLHSTVNAASCSVARSAGFASEGTKRQALLHLDGWHDMHLHARLSSDE
jgi:RimJ/RimL family protein N-acetyltransferase